jgi:carbonic anhydrase
MSPTTLQAQWRTPWDYEGPRGADHWSELDPDYAACAGKQQSPIDIQYAEKAFLPALHFEYKSEPLKYLINVRPPQPLNGRIVKESR